MPYHVVYAIAIAFLLFGMVGALILSRRNAGRAFRFKAALQSLVDHEVPLCAQHYLLAKVALAKDATDALAWLEVEYAAALKREAPQTVPSAPSQPQPGLPACDAWMAVPGGKPPVPASAPLAQPVPDYPAPVQTVIITPFNAPPTHHVEP